MATSPDTAPLGPFESAALAQLRAWDARWAELCQRMAAGPWDAGVLPRRLAELVGVAVCAAATNLNAEGVRRHIRGALAAGATRDEVLMVLKMAMLMSIHSCSLGAPILLEEARAIGASALAAAVVVKLGRVLMLAPVLAVLSVRRRRLLGDAADIKRPPIVPLFVLGFLVLVLVRSTGIVPPEVLHGAKTVQTVLLAMAMFALGCGVRLTQVRSMGIRPLLLAALSTVIVATTGLTGVLLLS